MHRKTRYCQNVSFSQLDIQICHKNQSKILVSYFVNINKLILRFIKRDKKSSIANTRLKENNKVRGLTLLALKLNDKAIVIKRGMSKNIDNRFVEWSQEYRNKSTDVYCLLITYKGT